MDRINVTTYYYYYYPLLKGHVQYVHWIRVAANIHTYIISYIIHYHWLNMNVYIA